MIFNRYSLLVLVCLLVHTFSAKAQTVIVDYESPTTSNLFERFGIPAQGTLTSMIANPAADAVNGSANVGSYTKLAGSQTWAGCSIVQPIVAPVDFTAGGTICVKVWYSQAGNLALKLEGASGGGPNWITQQPVTTTGAWTEICFSAADLSFEAPNQSAVGRTYSSVVLFPDFGNSPAADVTYYFDDIISNPSTVTSGDVTFSVDMSNYANTFTTVYVSGNFNSWSGNSNPLSDADGDGVWTGTINIPVGQLEYKFTIDNWAAQEQFVGGESCTQVFGQFVNRVYTVAGNASLPTVCFNSCFACGGFVNITFNVGTSNITVSPDGIFLAGGGNFGIPGDNPMVGNANGVYTITVQRPVGFSSFYTFANGACTDWSCKENLAGQACANPNNFNDRFFAAVMNDTIINTCFGQCNGDTICTTGPASGDITFQVDMQNYTAAFTTVYVSGTFNNWSGDAFALSDGDGDGVWTGTTNLNGGNHEFKFTIDNWAAQENFAGGEPCTQTTGGFTNRTLSVNGTATLSNVCFNSCAACIPAGINQLAQLNFQIVPTLVKDQLMVNFNETGSSRNLRISNQLGQTVYEAQINGDVYQYSINAAEWANGLYFVNITEAGKVGTQKVVVAK
jgi:hypothetical protein